jgi:uncharacterized protein YxjI
MTNLAVASPQGIVSSPFSHSTYTITRKAFTFLGRDFQVLDPSGALCMFVQHKLFTFKDEWNIFADRSASQPLVRVKAREAIAINITSDVFDAASGATVGTVRSKGLKSMVSDTWEVLNPGGEIIGELKEDSNGLLRRMLPSFFGMPLIPGRWHLTVNGQTVMEITESRTFFLKTFHVNLTPGAVDARFGIGCALLALMKEVMRESK